MPTALVTGASRGIGRGIASALDAAGYRVFATGRSIAAADLPSGVVRLPCDHLDDGQTESAFGELARQASQLDILVNGAWGGYEQMVENGAFTWGLPFWRQPMHRWTSMIDVGVRAAFVVSALAAPMMIQHKRGLIANLGHWAAQKRIGNTLYGISKAATDKMTADMAQELKEHGVAVVSIYPGLVRTEKVREAARSGAFDLSNSESPEFIGRVIAALAGDSKLMDRSGNTLVAAAVACELGVADIDGKQPTPLTLKDV